MQKTQSGMKNLYYLAWNIYQYSFVKTVYREIGGEFIVHKPRTILQLKQNFRDYPSKNPSRGWFGIQPKTRYQKYKDYSDLSGILFCSTQQFFDRDPEKLVTINTGHGTGYKVPRNQDYAKFDYYFLDGPLRRNRLDNITNIKPDEDQLIQIGNMRFDDVISGRLDREKILNDFGVRDRNRPNILYAPTWNRGGGLLLKHSFSLIDELALEYNLFIRPHYYDWRNMKPIKKYVKKHGYQHVYLVEPWNIRTKDTMENLAITDLLISDNSSIAYQSLIFKIPVILAEISEEKIVDFPEKFDIRAVVDHWNDEHPIKPLVDENLRENKYRKELNQLLENCFYFNDGKATERAVNFLRKLGG